jgi:hypothetical protein
VLLATFCTVTILRMESRNKTQIILDRGSLLFFLSVSIILLFYGIGTLAFYGVGILLLWPALLYLTIAFGIWRRKEWEIHISIILSYVLFFTWGYMILNNYLDCLRPQNSIPHCRNGIFFSDEYVSLAISVGTLCLIGLRYYLRPIKLRSFLWGCISPVTMLALLWTLGIGYYIWTY